MNTGAGPGVHWSPARVHQGVASHAANTIPCQPTTRIYVELRMDSTPVDDEHEDGRFLRCRRAIYLRLDTRTGERS
jgi:hypothetical protein